MGNIIISPSQSPSSTPPSSTPKVEKTAIILVTDRDNLKPEWYAFDIFDEPKHNLTFPPWYANRHSPPLHDEEEAVMKCVNCTPKKAVAKYGDRLDCWAVLGTSIYYVKSVLSIDQLGVHWDQMGGNSVYRIDLPRGGSCSTEWESVDPMPNQTINGHTLVVGEKLYCLGGRERRKGEPWAVAYDPALKTWESLPDPPRRPAYSGRPLFSAAMEDVPRPYIIAGSPLEGILQIYWVDTKRWEEQPREFDNKELLAIDEKLTIGGYPLAIDNKLYWYNDYDSCLNGYDLVTKSWLRGCVPIHDYDGKRYGYIHDDGKRYGYIRRPRLAHLGGGRKFCLFWVSLLPPSSPLVEDNLSRLHCFKFQVTASIADGDPPRINGGVIIPLEVSILSCQSTLVSGSKYFVGSSVVDGFMGCNDLKSSNPRMVKLKDSFPLYQKKQKEA